MRKFLSLVLALVMMMSLVTINAGAKEFTDGDDITYREAVDVISTIHVVDGYSDGDFKPGNNLTRGAAAKIICNMILGPTTAAELHADTAPYRDVPVTSDFAGYIAYCQKEGIISGYADGSFRPAGTLTGYAFMKMLLGALGYDAEIEGYTGPNWSINVAKKAIGLGLNASLEKTFNGVDFVTREEAALYAFNTLKADLVEYSSKITANVNGAEVTVGNSNATPQEWESQKTRSDNIYKDGLVQFAEQYFNRLVLTEDVEVFGRPDREWRYDGEDIGTYVNMDLFKQEYTAKVTGRDLYDLLGSRTIDEYDFTITIDGEVSKSVLDQGTDDPYFTEENLIRSNTEAIGATGNGVLTQVFVDNDKDVEHVWIAVINTYLAKATEDYNEKKDEVEYRVWSILDTTNNSANDPILVKYVGDREDPQSEDLKVSGEDFDIEEVKENDIVLVHVADGAIQEFVDPEVLDETTLVSFKDGSWVKAEEQYDYAHSAQYDVEVLDQYDDSNMKDVEYCLYLDEYGYMIGIEIIEEPNQYVFLTGIDLSTSNLANKTADGNIIKLDGTIETVKINMDKSKNAAGEKFSAASGDETDVSSLMNTWCRFTVGSNGVYTLLEVPNDDGSWDSGAKTNNSKGKAAQGRDDAAAGDAAAEILTLDKSHIYMTSDLDAYKRVYGNDDTVFLVAEVEEITATNIPHGDTKTDAIIISGVDSVTVGAQNVNLKAWNANMVLDNTEHTGAIAANTSHGVYSLFNDKGFVIAAVVVGEDDGTTSNYAFVTSSNMTQEDYSKADDEYTWSREVIINGELTTITEKGDSEPEIANSPRGNMNKGHWCEVKYYADGTVRSVTDLSTNNIVTEMPCHDMDDSGDWTYGSPNTFNNGTSPVTGRNEKYIHRIEDVEAATDEENTVLLWDNLMTGDGRKIRVEGSTLQVYTQLTDKKGFSVNPNAKVVLIQDVKPSNRDMKYMDSIEEISGTGTEALKRAVNRVNKNDDFVGFIGAIFENGLATSVVIYDKTKTDVNQGVIGGGDEGFQSSVTQSGSRLIVRTTTNDGDGPEVHTLLMNWLYNNGYTPISVVTSSTGVETADNWTILARDPDGRDVYLSSDLIPVSTFTLNGETVYKAAGETISVTGNWVMGSTAAKVAHGGTADSTGIGDITVAWSHNGQFIKTETITVNSDPNCRVGETYTLSTATGTWGQYDTNKYVALTPSGAGGADRDFEIKADMAGKTVTGGFFKITRGADVEYVEATDSATTVIDDLAGSFAKTSDGDFLPVTGNALSPDDLDGEGNAIDADVTIVDDGYYSVTEPATKTVNTGMTIDVAASEEYAKENGTVTLTITIGGTSDNTTAATVTVAGTGAAFGGTNGSDLATSGTAPSGMTSAVKTSNTVLTFTPTAAAVSGTYTVELTVGTANVTFS